MADIGTFSVSLAVADMAASRGFYENLGFEMMGGDGESWTIMASGSTVIGLFHGMFDNNIMTFNPGWAGPGQEAEKFTDVRELEKRLKAAGVEILTSNTAESESGPAHCTFVDPDGNAIMFDQHV